MSILSLFDIAKTGLGTQRMALDVTSENVANVNTPGYSRQTTIFETAPISLDRGFPLGTGASIAEIQRSYDDFLQRQIKSENSAYGESKTQLSSMQRVEQLFNEFTSDGLGKSIQDFFHAWQDLASNPQGQPERQAILARAQQVVDNFHLVNGYLNDVKRDANKSLEGLTADVNDKISQIASLNDQIKQVELSTGRANELRDKRDLLVRDLAQKVGINYIEQSDGMVNVSLSLGQPLVDGNKAATLSLQPDAAKGGFYDVLLTPPRGTTAIDVTTIVGGPNNSQGEMGGTLQVRDTLVNNFLSDLDELAANMAGQVNDLHSAGFGLTSSTGLNFFTPSATDTGATVAGSNTINGLTSTAGLSVGMFLSGPGIPPSAKITSILGPASIQISANATATAAASAFGFYNASGYSGAGGINVNITNTNDIAAADTDPAVGGTGNNKNASSLASVNDKILALSGGSMTLGEFYNSLVGKVGVSVQNADRGASKSDGVLKQLNNLRESNSGVSLDEELANLIKYQKAFEGSAKLINTGAEMLDTILGLVR